MATQRKNEFIPSSPSRQLKLYRNDSVEFEEAPPLLEDVSPVGITLGDFIYPDVVARQVCFWGGLVFSCIGGIEFFFPEATGTLVSRFHSFFYLAAGAALVLPAMTLSPRALGRASVGLGLFFAILGFCGFLMGAPGMNDRFLWTLVPGDLVFGTKDHILQEVIGVTLILSGLRYRRKRKSELLDMTIK